MSLEILDPLTQLGLGKLEKDHTYLVVGDRGAGKTLFCMLAALGFASNNLRVAYVLTEGSQAFRVAERLVINHRLPEEVLGHLFFMMPFDRDAEATIPSLIKAIKPSMFIFDEVNWGYASYIVENNKLAVYRNRLLSNVLADIHSIRKNTHLTIIYTADLFQGKTLAYNVLNYFSDSVVELNKLGDKQTEYRADLIIRGSTLKSYSYTIGRLGFQVGGNN